MLLAIINIMFLWYMFHDSHYRSDNLVIIFFPFFEKSAFVIGDSFETLLTISIFSLSPIICYFSTFALLSVISWPYVVLFWVLLLGICTSVWKAGKRRERQAANPLHGIL